MKRETNYMNFVNGSLAGIFAKSIVAPLDRIKFIFMTSSRPFTYKAGFYEMVDIVKKKNFTHLWRGNTLNCLRVAPYAGIVK